MPKAKTPDVTYVTITIDEKEAEALFAVLSQAADFCEQHGAHRDLVKRLKAASDGQSRQGGRARRIATQSPHALRQGDRDRK
jgi:hypothetical protein